jgi:hypothetical protein
MALLMNPHTSPSKPRRNGAISRLRKLDIMRHGVTGWTDTIRLRTERNDPRTAAQMACRAPMHFAAQKYPGLNGDEIAEWNEVHPKDFFCDAVHRWLTGHSPCVSPYYPLDDASEITIAASATYTTSGILILFTPSLWYGLWGVAIIRSSTPIETPDPFTLRAIVPHNTAPQGSWIDADVKPGTYHYRLCACEIDGRIGAFSADISATVP